MSNATTVPLPRLFRNPFSKLIPAIQTSTIPPYQSNPATAYCSNTESTTLPTKTSKPQAPSQATPKTSKMPYMTGPPYGKPTVLPPSSSTFSQTKTPLPRSQSSPSRPKALTLKPSTCRNDALTRVSVSSLRSCGPRFMLRTATMLNSNSRVFATWMGARRLKSQQMLGWIT